MKTKITLFVMAVATTVVYVFWFRETDFRMFGFVLGWWAVAPIMVAMAIISSYCTCVIYRGTPANSDLLELWLFLVPFAASLLAARSILMLFSSIPPMIAWLSSILVATAATLFVMAVSRAILRKQYDKYWREAHL